MGGVRGWVGSGKTQELFPPIRLCLRGGMGGEAAQHEGNSPD